MWDHLRKSVQGGVVPAQALTTGPGEESRRWWRGFVNEVVDEAQERGLAGPVARKLALLVGVIGFIPAALLGLAFGETAFFASVILPVAVIGRILYGRRQRDTDDGLAAAGLWRAVQAKLGEDPVFAEQPPHAVELWERLLAYGAALGVAPAAVRPIPMGSEPENRAWSTYGGRWHQVDVRYRHGPQWGQHPGWALLRGSAAGGLAVLPRDRRAGAVGCIRRRGRNPRGSFSWGRSRCQSRSRSAALSRARAGAEFFKSKEVTARSSGSVSRGRRASRKNTTSRSTTAARRR